MRQTRLFVHDRLGPGAELSLDADTARYLGRVLRLAVGDTVSVFNGECGEWLATITALGKERAAVQLTSGIDTATESSLKVHLVQGVSRGERMDFVVQKATELGVKRITPVLTQYGVVKLDGRRAGKRRDHWQRIAESACEQSGRTRPPLVDTPISLNAWFGLGEARDSTELILTPGASARLADVPKPEQKLCLLVGSEGGFSDREYEDAAVAGFKSVSLGPRVLRTETAAVAALAIAQSQWGDM